MTKHYADCSNHYSQYTDSSPSLGLKQRRKQPSAPWIKTLRRELQKLLGDTPLYDSLPLEFDDADFEERLLRQMQEYETREPIAPLLSQAFVRNIAKNHHASWCPHLVVKSKAIKYKETPLIFNSIPQGAAHV